MAKRTWIRSYPFRACFRDSAVICSRSVHYPGAPVEHRDAVAIIRNKFAVVSAVSNEMLPEMRARAMNQDLKVIRLRKSMSTSCANKTPSEIQKIAGTLDLPASELSQRYDPEVWHSFASATVRII